jgi:2-phosphoglycerate kinase
MKHRLRHVRWIGGGSGAGKSTVARKLADEHGLRVYSSDATLRDHIRRSDAMDHPLIHAFLAMDLDERWVDRPPSVMLETFHGFQGEAFELIVEDLLALPDDPPILAEGFRLLPRLVAPLLSPPDQAVWLVPTPEFRRAAFDARGFTWEIPHRTSDPERALANLLERDRLFTSQVTREATALQLAMIEVDVGRSVAEVTRLVAGALGLPAQPDR